MINKKKLYNNIITDISKIVKKEINESFDILDGAYWQLYEMSRIGNIGNYTIFINSDDPGYIPHFHIIDSPSYKNKQKDPWKFHTCLKIESSEYFHHKSKFKEDYINKKFVKELITFLKAKKNNMGITNWQYLISIWNDNNSKVNVNINIDVPDYTNIKED